MNERRSLIDGLKQTPPIDPKIEKDFVFKSKSPASDEAPAKNVAATTIVPSKLIAELALFSAAMKAVFKWTTI